MCYVPVPVNSSCTYVQKHKDAKSTISYLASPGALLLRGQLAHRLLLGRLHRLEGVQKRVEVGPPHGPGRGALQLLHALLVLGRLPLQGLHLFQSQAREGHGEQVLVRGTARGLLLLLALLVLGLGSLASLCAQR